MTARHIGLVIGLAAMVLFLPGLSAGPAWAGQPGDCPADLVAGPGRALAYPAVSGTVGPFAHARVTLIGATMLAGPFTGRLDVPGGRCVLLAGPEDPTGLFDFFVNRVMFMPVEPGQANGIVVLYDKVHRSPGSPSFAEILVYRVDGEGVTRDPALERQLDGVRRAAQVRRRLLSRSRAQP